MASIYSRSLCFVVLLLSASAYVLHFDEAASNKPIRKVVNLLQEISTRLEEDAKADEELMDKLKCWCKANYEGKQKTGSDAREKIAQLTTAKAEAEATSQRLAPEIRSLQVTVQDLKHTLDKAASIRAQQVANFKEDEAALQGSIKQVADAAEALGVKTSATLLQTKPQQLADQVRQVLEVQSVRVSKRLSHTDRVTLDNFLQDPTTVMKSDGQVFLQMNRNAQAPVSSDGVRGILQSLADDFASDLQKELDEEKENKKHYEALNTAKQAEITSGEASLSSKSEQKAEKDVFAAQAARDIKALTKQAEADEAFAKAIEEKCEGSEAEFQARSTARSEELGAVSKAIEVLESDEARDLTVSFLQESSGDEKKCKQAAEVLSAAGKKLGNQALVTMAMEVNGPATSPGLANVTKAMQDMVSALKAQQADEAKEKDVCEDSLNKNELATEDKTEAKTTAESKAANLKYAVDKAKTELEALEADVKEMNKQIAIAGENRQKENEEFQATVGEQKESQAVLKKAKAVVAAVYEAPAAPSFVQVQKYQAEPDPLAGLGAPEGFKEMKKNGGGKGVVQLLDQIIEDCGKVEAEAIKDEQDAQTAYEAFTASNDKAVKVAKSRILQVSSEKADAEADLAEAKAEITSTAEEISQLKITKAQLEGDCTWLLNNFDASQAARAQEMQAIEEAKAMLKGAKFS